MTPHKHAEVIKAWADGAAIQARWPNMEWQTISGATAWSEECEYRVKPEPPAKVYPETRMTDSGLLDAYRGRIEGNLSSLRNVANAALRHAMDSGQVFDASEALHRATRLELETYRTVVKKEQAARDLAVAKAVENEVRQATANLYTGRANYEIDLPAIIATVKDQP